MINAGQEFRKGFFRLLETFGGTVLLHRNLDYDNSEMVELKGMKNSKQEDSSVIMFQFPDWFDVNIGDVIQQKESSEYWKIYETEEKIVTDVFVYFILYVNKLVR